MEVRHFEQNVFINIINYLNLRHLDADAISEGKQMLITYHIWIYLCSFCLFYYASCVDSQ
jgi:hypothetical protein